MVRVGSAFYLGQRNPKPNGLKLVLVLVELNRRKQREKGAFGVALFQPLV